MKSTLRWGASSWIRSRSSLPVIPGIACVGDEVDEELSYLRWIQLDSPEVLAWPDQQDDILPN